jgi:hypothetical protein
MLGKHSITEDHPQPTNCNVFNDLSGGTKWKGNMRLKFQRVQGFKESSDNDPFNLHLPNKAQCRHPPNTKSLMILR